MCECRWAWHVKSALLAFESVMRLELAVLLLLESAVLLLLESAMLLLLESTFAWKLVTRLVGQKIAADGGQIAVEVAAVGRAVGGVGNVGTACVDHSGVDAVNIFRGDAENVFGLVQGFDFAATVGPDFGAFVGRI